MSRAVRAGVRPTRHEAPFERHETVVHGGGARRRAALERPERAALQVQAAASGLTASAYARQVLLAAMRKEKRHAR